MSPLDVPTITPKLRPMADEISSYWSHTTNIFYTLPFKKLRILIDFLVIMRCLSFSSLKKSWMIS